MAVALEFISVLIPIATIRRKYPGGWEACASDYSVGGNSSVWFDWDLFRLGAMNSIDVMMELDRWKARGFHVAGKRGGQDVWKDACVLEALSDGPTLPCSWLDCDMQRGIAWLKGMPPGPICGPRNPFGSTWFTGRARY